LTYAMVWIWFIPPKDSSFGGLVPNLAKLTCVVDL
jgi:hypothetical protein